MSRHENIEKKTELVISVGNSDLPILLDLLGSTVLSSEIEIVERIHDDSKRVPYFNPDMVTWAPTEKPREMTPIITKSDLQSFYLDDNRQTTFSKDTPQEYRKSTISRAYNHIFQEQLRKFERDGASDYIYLSKTSRVYPSVRPFDDEGFVLDNFQELIEDVMKNFQDGNLMHFGEKSMQVLSDYCQELFKPQQETKKKSFLMALFTR